MRIAIILAVLGIALLLLGAFLLLSPIPRTPKEVSIAGFSPTDGDGDGIIEEIVVPVGDKKVIVDIEDGSIETEEGAFVDNDGDGIVDTYRGRNGQEEKALEPKGPDIPRIIIEVNTDIDTGGLPVVVGEENDEVKATVFIPGNIPGVAVDVDGDGLYDILQKGKKIYFDEDGDGTADSMTISDNAFIIYADLKLKTFEADVNRDGTVDIEGNEIYVCIDWDHDGVCEIEIDASGEEPKYTFDPADVIKMGGPDILEKLNDQEKLRSYFFERFRNYIDAFQGLLEERDRDKVTLPRFETQTVDVFPSPSLPEINVEGAEVNACMETARWYIEYLKESPHYREDIETKVYPYEDQWHVIKAVMYLKAPARDIRLLEPTEINYVYVMTDKKPLKEFAIEPTRVYIYYTISGTWETKEAGENGYQWVEKNTEKSVAIYCDGFGRITYGIFLWWDRE